MLAVLAVALQTLSAQVQVAGVVRDAETGEQLAHVRVYAAAQKRGSLSNAYGYFSLSLAPGEVAVELSLAGYASLQLQWMLRKDTFLELRLSPRSALFDTVAIEAPKPYSAADVQMGGIAIPVAQLRNMPAIGGEGDALKAIQMLPGVQMGHEGTAGLYVRGGSPDQNLILLDEMPVYNVNHLFGYFSLFPPDALASAELLRGSFPARYGGRLSSVIQLSSREGSRRSYHHTVAFSPVAGRFTSEGPLVRDKASFFIAGRRTWLDAIAGPVSAWLFRRQTQASGRVGYGFHDLIAKINYQSGKHGQLFLSYYTGRDRASVRTQEDFLSDSTQLASRSQLSWGNHSVSLRYIRIHGSRLFSKLTTGYTQYSFLSENRYSFQQIKNDSLISDFRFQNGSRISDLILKGQQDYHFGGASVLSWGIELSQKWFRPSIEIRKQLDGSADEELRQLEPVRSSNGAIYAEADWLPFPWLRVYAGLRGEYFQVDSFRLPSLQPRFSLRLSLSGKSSFKVSGGYVVQYLHLLTNTGVGLPTDLWVPATARVRPETSWQGAAGFYRDFTPALSVSVEAYYKTLEGLIEYEEGASFLNAFETWENKVVTGSGESYGLEFFLHKTAGKWQGWASYTWSKASRTFPSINGGEAFPFRFDRRHALSLFCSYELRAGHSVSASWTYMSGARASIPLYRYDIPQNEFAGSDITFNPLSFQEFTFGQYASFLDTRNNYQLPDFHKLDLSYQWAKPQKRGSRSWVLGIYNAYARFNPVGIFLVQDYVEEPGPPATVRPVARFKLYSYFRWVPSVSWERKF